MINLLFAILFAVSAVGSAIATPTVLPQEGNLGLSIPQSPALFETSLQAPMTAAATSMTLTANSVRGGGSLTGYNCFTIDEGSAQAEFVCGTVSGTSVSSLSRGVSPSTGTSTVSALQFSHRRGANVKITDFPTIQILKALANGQDEFPNTLHYMSSAVACTGNDDICDKEYIDGVAVAGASNANTTTKGIVEIATSAETAAGTATGGTGATLVPANSMFNQTWTAAAHIPETNSSGKFDQRVLDLTQHFVYTSIFGTRASSTHATTTTRFALPYISTGKLLKVDSTGAIGPASTSTDYQAQRLTQINRTDVNPSAGAFATSSDTMTIPAGLLTASSTITVKGGGACTGNGGGCNVYLRLSDGTTIGSVPWGTPGNGLSWESNFEIVVQMNNSVSSQQYVGYASSIDAGTVSGIRAGDQVNSEGTSSVNFATAQTIVVVINGDGSADGLLNQHMIIVEP